MENQLNYPISNYKNWSNQLAPYSIFEQLYERNSTSIVCGMRRLGVEIEVERAQNDSVGILNPYIVTTTEDGSLRNNGLEYVTGAIPAKFIYAALENIYSHISDKADFSPRTSIHVHVDARDLSYNQITALSLVYIAVERSLYRWIGRNRYKSIFCVPLQETVLPIKFLRGLASGKPFQNFNWMKYTGYNLLPLIKQGTIEFRHLHGTRDLNRIYTWIDLILHMFNYVINSPYELIEQRITNLNSNSEYYSFLVEVFGHNLAQLFVGTDEYIKEVEAGVSYIKGNNYQNGFATALQKKFDYEGPLAKRLGIKPRRAASEIFAEMAANPQSGISAQDVYNTATSVQIEYGPSDGPQPPTLQWPSTATPKKVILKKPISFWHDDTVHPGGSV